jgi:hypothetical protein
MRALVSLPGYLLFVVAMLKVFVFPATERIGYRDHPLVGMTTLQTLTLIGGGAAWLRWAAPALQVSVPKAARRLVSLFWRLRWPIAAVLVAVLLIMGVRAFYFSNTAKPVPPLSWDEPFKETKERNATPQVSSPSVPPPQSGPAQHNPPAQVTPPPPRVPTWVPTVEDLANALDIKYAASVIDIYVNISHETWRELNPDDQDTLCNAGKEIRTAMKAWNNRLSDLNHTERAIYDLTAPRGRCP